MGRLGGWRSPQQGGFHKGFCFNGCFAVCLNEHVHFGSKGQSRSLRLPVAPQIKDFGLQFYRSSPVEVVGYSCFYLYRCLCLCDFWRGDVSAPLGYVHRFGFVEPNIAVKSPSRIPARAVRRIVDAYGQLVFAAKVDIGTEDRKSTRLNSSHVRISYAVFCLKKKKN